MTKNNWGQKFSEFSYALDDYIATVQSNAVLDFQNRLSEADRAEAHLAKVKVLSLFNDQLTRNQVEEQEKNLDTRPHLSLEDLPPPF